MSPVAYLFDEQITKLKQFCAGRFPAFVQPSLHRTLKLIVHCNIGVLPPAVTIKSEMAQAVGVLTPTMFNAENQP